MKLIGIKSRKKTYDAKAALLEERRNIDRLREELDKKSAQFEQYYSSKLADLNHKLKELEDKQQSIKIAQHNIDSLVASIGDFIHEQKRINERANKAIDITNAILRRHKNENRLDVDTTNLVLNNWKTLEGLADISNSRMELFEFSVAPELFKNLQDEYLSPFRICEKIYKSINSGFDKEARNFNLNGHSYGKFKTKRILPIAIFILLDNAWKYTIPDKEIIISFKEESKNLTIKITNWGPWIEDSEIEQLTHRGFRGKNARITHRDNGKGLGLMIVKQILEICRVNLKIYKEPCTPETFNGVQYGIFCVELQFSPISHS